MEATPGPTRLQCEQRRKTAKLTGRQYLPAYGFLREPGKYNSQLRVFSLLQSNSVFQPTSAASPPLSRRQRQQDRIEESRAPWFARIGIYR
jgi:hypothetical protein